MGLLDRLNRWAEEVNGKQPTGPDKRDSLRKAIDEACKAYFECPPGRSCLKCRDEDICTIRGQIYRRLRDFVTLKPSAHREVRAEYRKERKQ